jgi:hypothetical protein
MAGALAVMVNCGGYCFGANQAVVTALSIKWR